MANIVRIKGKTVKDLAAAADIAVVNVKIGNLANLDTTAKNSFIAAINEVTQNDESIPLAIVTILLVLCLVLRGVSI